MTALALAQRALSATAYRISNGKRIAYRDLQSGANITNDHFTLLRDAHDQFNQLPITIDPQPNLTVAQIAMRARRRSSNELKSLVEGGKVKAKLPTTLDSDSEVAR